MRKVIIKGDYVEKNCSFSTNDVQLFADVSGDINPIHLSEEFASKSIFKKPIVHGFLYSSIISSLIANELPGPGSIYKSQTLNFLAPIYHDQEITVRVEVKDVIAEKHIYILTTTIFDCKDPNKVILIGEAVIKKI